MDQTDEEADGELQNGVGDDDSGSDYSDNAGCMKSTQEIVFRALQENGAAVQVTLDSDLKDDLDLDSLEVVQTLLDIEEQVGKEIDVQELWGIHTVQDLIEIVEGHL